MKSKLLHAVAAATILGVCAFTGTGTQAADTYDINVIMPLTGGGAFLGKSEQEAILLAEKLTNDTGGIHGRQVRFIFNDDQSSPQTAVQLTNGILASKPKVVIGSSLVAMCNAMTPLMANGPVMYCLSPGIHPKDGGYVFVGNTSTSDITAAQVRYFRERGWKRLAILTSSDASGQDAEREILKSLDLPENKDVVLVDKLRFNTTDLSADAQIQSIKSKDPQALIAWTSGTALGTVLKSIARAGLDIPVATSNSNMNPVQMAQYRDFAPKQLFFSNSNWLPTVDKADTTPEVQRAKDVFINAFSDADKKVTNAAALAWDPVMIVVAALRALPLDASAADLRAYLAGLKGFPGSLGSYDFTAVPQRGLDGSSGVVTQWNAESNDWSVVSHPRGKPLAQ